MALRGPERQCTPREVGILVRHRARQREQRAGNGIISVSGSQGKVLKAGISCRKLPKTLQGERF